MEELSHLFKTRPEGTKLKRGFLIYHGAIAFTPVVLLAIWLANRKDSVAREAEVVELAKEYREYRRLRITNESLHGALQAEQSGHKANEQSLAEQVQDLKSQVAVLRTELKGTKENENKAETESATVREIKADPANRAAEAKSRSITERILNQKPEEIPAIKEQLETQPSTDKSLLSRLGLFSINTQETQSADSADGSDAGRK
eukprot:Clim_evm59s11 gene=Clim_evmTU59s11